MKETTLKLQLEDLDKKAEIPEIRLREINNSIAGKKDDEIETSVKDEQKSVEEQLANIEGSEKEPAVFFWKGCELLRNWLNLALLANGMLKWGEIIDRFIKRSLS